jgi:hypothetical protein
MKSAKVTYALGLAMIVEITMFGGWLHAQDKPDPNAAPNPYRMLDNWAQLPEGRQWGAPIGVEVDHRDGKSIWVFDRCGENSCTGSNLAPIMKFDPSGKLVANFGAGMFNFPHGLFVDRDGNVWVTDGRGESGKGHTVIKFAPDGKVLMTLGKPGVAGDGPDTFNSLSDVVVAPNVDIFVADGHGEGTNDRIVKLSKDGKFIKAWESTVQRRASSTCPIRLPWIPLGAFSSETGPIAASRFSTRTEDCLPSGDNSGGRAACSSTRTTLSMWPTRNRIRRAIRVSSRASGSGASKTARSLPLFRYWIRSFKGRKRSRQTTRGTSMGALPASGI